MIYSQYKENPKKILDIIKDIKDKYNNFGGVFIWEYLDAKSNIDKTPADWCVNIYNILYKK